MRSQANTARLLADNPPLKCMRDLEALQAIGPQADLKVVVGSTSLSEPVPDLL